jgi:hypothetical protein
MQSRSKWRHGTSGYLSQSPKERRYTHKSRCRNEIHLGKLTTVTSDAGEYLTVRRVDEPAMAPHLPPLARSDSKAKFFQRLELSSQKSSDNRLYELMKVGFNARVETKMLC